MRVMAAKVNNYHSDVVSSGIQEVLQGLGGLVTYINPGERVLLKPNLVEGMPPEKAVNTHPWVIREVLFFEFEQKEKEVNKLLHLLTSMFVALF